MFGCGLVEVWGGLGCFNGPLEKACSDTKIFLAIIYAKKMSVEIIDHDPFRRNNNEGSCFRSLNVNCVVMQISMRMQIIVGIWVLVSIMDFMPGKGEHETGIFATLREKPCDIVALCSC